MATRESSANSAALSRRLSSTFVRTGAPNPRRTPRRNFTVQFSTTRGGFDVVHTHTVMLLGALCRNPWRCEAAAPPRIESEPALSSPAQAALVHVGAWMQNRPLLNTTHSVCSLRMVPVGNSVSCAWCSTPACRTASASRWFGKSTRVCMSTRLGGGPRQVHEVGTQGNTCHGPDNTQRGLGVQVLLVVEQNLNT